MRVASNDLSDMSTQHRCWLYDSTATRDCLGLKIRRYPLCRNVERGLLRLSSGKIDRPWLRAHRQEKSPAELPPGNFDAPRRSRHVLLLPESARVIW